MWADKIRYDRYGGIITQVNTFNKDQETQQQRKTRAENDLEKLRYEFLSESENYEKLTSTWSKFLLKMMFFFEISQRDELDKIELIFTQF